MNPQNLDEWKSQVLDHIFQAIAESRRLAQILIFKGARILNLRLGGGRKSLDIDSNLQAEFAMEVPRRDDQKNTLETELAPAIRRHFEKQNPVVLELKRIHVTLCPAKNHPRGWNAFKVRVVLTDLTGKVKNLPALDIDIAAPEKLNDLSVSPMKIGEGEINAYTLERIAGEKLRAFLSSLPAYRKKVNKPGNAVRAKDLYDLCRILDNRSINDKGFWQAVGNEFKTACESRFIDCLGPETFKEQWDVTKVTYSEALIPKDISFDRVEVALNAIIRTLEKLKVIPFEFSLPN